MSDEQKEPHPDCWPFDPNPPVPAKSTNGFIRCPVCERVQPVAGHECRAVAEALDEWGPGEEENSLREQAEAAARLQAQAELNAIEGALGTWAPDGKETLAEAVSRLRHAYAEMFNALRAENRALRQAAEALEVGNVATLPETRAPVDLVAENLALRQSLEALKAENSESRAALGAWAPGDGETLAEAVLRLRQARQEIRWPPL